jgi:hypothetical protein
MKVEQEHKLELKGIDSGHILSPLKTGGTITRTLQPKSLRGGGGLRFFGGGESASRSMDQHEKENPSVENANAPVSSQLSKPESISPARNVLSRILGQK